MSTFLAPFLCASVLLCSTTALRAAAPQGKTRHLTAPDQVPEGLAKSDWQSIRAAHEAGLHAVQPIEGGWQACNPGQQWTTTFDGRGFLTSPRDGAWQWGLELKSYGFGENQNPVNGTPAVKAGGRGLAYQWDAAVQEWFVNDRRGLEHGFTVKERPESPVAAPAPLAFTFSTRGTLRPRVSTDAQTVLFLDASGATVLNYSGLKVWDADGKVLASHFTPVAGGVRLWVEERGARYPLTIDPVAQRAFLKPAAVGTTQAGDYFGSSVAVSGDTVVVGAPNEDSASTGVNSAPDEDATSSGAAYVFVRSGTGWAQQAYLKPAAVGTTQAGDYFGSSVAISGDTVVVGAYGEDSATTGVNSTPNEGKTDSGAAYVFVRSGTVWTQQAYLKPAAVGSATDWFGRSVAVAGDTVVVGAYGEDSSTTGVNSTPNEGSADSGAAYVFVRSGTVWAQQAYLKPAVVGTTQAEDHFGWAVAVAGDTAVVGAYGEDSSTTGVNASPDEDAPDSGAAYVFVRSGTVWTQQACLKPAAVGATQAGDRFGWSVAVSGDTAVVGAYGEDSAATGVNSSPDEGATDSGAAYVFARSGSVWTQQACLKPAAVGTTQAGDWFGWSVAVAGDTAVVGAREEDSSTTGVYSEPDEGAFSSGAAYVFARSGTVWTQQAYLKPAAVGTTQAVDWFGTSVAVAGNTAVVGAPREDSAATGVNSAPDEGASASGAAYVFAIGSHYNLWAQDNGVAGGMTDDQDSDGLNNQGEYVFGGDPDDGGLGDLGTQPRFDGEGGYIFSIRNDNTLKYCVLTNHNLVSGSWGTNYMGSISLNNGEMQTYTNHIVTSADQLFIKLQVEFAIDSLYDLWALNNGVLGGMMDDQDSDGLNNWGEYIFGGDPNDGGLGDIGTQPRFDGEGGYIFSIRNDNTLTYCVLTNRNLVSGFWGTNHWGAISLNNGEMQTYTNHVGTSADQLFIKLQVEAFQTH